MESEHAAKVPAYLHPKFSTVVNSPKRNDLARHRWSSKIEIVRIKLHPAVVAMALTIGEAGYGSTRGINGGSTTTAI